MNCAQAQKLIRPFLEHSIPDHELSQFLEHVRYCPDCYDELGIYLAIGETLKSDNEKEDTQSYNFRDRLHKEIEDSEALLRAHRSQAIIRQCLILVGLMIVGMLVFTGIRQRKHPDLPAWETEMLSEAVEEEAVEETAAQETESKETEPRETESRETAVQETEMQGNKKQKTQGKEAAQETSKKEETAAQETSKKEAAAAQETSKKKEAAAQETSKKEETAAQGTAKKEEKAAQETSKNKGQGKKSKDIVKNTEADVKNASD